MLSPAETLYFKNFRWSNPPDPPPLVLAIGPPGNITLLQLWRVKALSIRTSAEVDLKQLQYPRDIAF